MATSCKSKYIVANHIGQKRVQRVMSKVYCGDNHSKSKVSILIMDCIATPEGAQGGSVRRFMGLAKRFRDLGVSSHIVEYPHFRLNYGETYESISSVKRLYPTGTIGGILNAIYLTPIVLRVCLRARVDAIYVNRVGALENPLSAFLVSKLSRKPLILVIHECPMHTTWGRLSIKKLISRKRNLKSLLLIMTSYLIRRMIYKFADACIVVSNQTAKEFTECFNPKQLYINGNGVDTEMFKPDPAASKQYDACYLGRIDQFQKNIELLLKCWRLVVDIRPDAKLMMIGDGSADYINNLKSQIIRLALESNIIFAGRVTDEEVVRLLRSSKLFLFPSKHEGFALAVAEAMACDLCCIISEIPV